MSTFFAYVFGLILLWFIIHNRRIVRYYLIFSAIWFYVAFGALVIGSLALFRPRDPTTINYTRLMQGLLNYLTGIKPDVRNPENIATDRGGFVVCNHQVSFDFANLYNIWPIARKMTMVAKSIIFYIWPFGLACWLVGIVFIDRQERAKSFETMQKYSKLTLGKNPTKIMVFPEGTRNKNALKTKTLLPFKNGAFRLAIACQVPIMPIVIGPYYFIDPKTYFFENGTVPLQMLPPIETTGMTENDVDDLRDRTQKMMQDAYTEMCKELETKLPETHPYFSH